MTSAVGTEQGQQMHLVDPALLAALGEHFASGFFEEPESPPVRRMARGIQRHLEALAPAPWEGEMLYPSGSVDLWRQGQAVYFNYSRSLSFDPQAVERLHDGNSGAEQTLDALAAVLRDYPTVGSPIPEEFRLGGAGYTHSIPFFGRICREGLDGYRERIEARLSTARQQGQTEEVNLFLALEDVLAGIRDWHDRCLAMLRNQDGASAAQETVRQQLVSALKQVPFRPARSFYEAMVATNFVYYLDGCDSLGRIDQDLEAWYSRDLAAGRVREDEAVGLFRNLWENVDANSGWNVALGGSTATGDPAYNGLTRVALKAAVSIRRPNLALRIRRDMPDEVFDLALDAIASGCGIPALYNEEGYLKALRAAHLNIQPEDLADFAFGGCTETMIHGKSNVGSLDAGINLPQVLVRTLEEYLEAAEDFADLLRMFKADLRRQIDRLVESVNQDQQIKARWQPQPMRSLLVDACIDGGVEFNDGGARYNWSVVNVGGLANVVDSLSAVRTLVYSQRLVSPGELLAGLRHDFAGDEGLRRRLERCPRFGNDQPEVDELAAELSAYVFGEFQRHAAWRGGHFLPGCLMFVTYAGAGEGVAATPDGRRAGTPIADSAGPYQGRDANGPTAMLRSVSSLAHRLAPGTLVVNARFSREMFTGKEQRSRLKALIRTYFDLGGMQLQINVVDQKTLRDAIAQPECHRDLIVRVGGYSEYFNRLSPALKQSLLERTEHC